MKKRISTIIFVLLLSLFVSLPTYAAVAGFPDSFIMDEAGLLSEAEISNLNEEAAIVSEYYNFPVMVVTMADIGGMNAAKFTENLYDSMGVGTEPDRSGVMLLVNMAERDVVLFTRGYGNTVFTDYGKEVLEGEFISALSAGNYYDSFMAYIVGCDQFLELAASGTPVDIVNKKGIGSYLAAIFVPLIISFIICKILAAGMKTAVPQRAARVYVVDGSFKLTKTQDVYTHTTQTRTKIEKSSGGGRSGGTSVSSSGSSSRSSKF